MVSRRDYPKETVEAAFSVLIEVMNTLGEYRHGIALIGGWVPELLFPEAKEKHVGSMDVDLALDHQVLQEPGYETICRLLEEKGYKQDDDQPFIFHKTFSLAGKTTTVQVDLSAGEYGGTGKGRRTQRVQDAQPRKARGCDLVFDMCKEILVEGTRPDGYKDSATIQIADVVPFLVMKGMAIVDRDKQKDAYDIYFCVNNYPDGLDALAEEFKPHLSNKLVQEGLKNIASKFASPEHVGPGHVADFEEMEDSEERAMLQRDAYERVHYLLEKLGVSL